MHGVQLSYTEIQLASLLPEEACGSNNDLYIPITIDTIFLLKFRRFFEHLDMLAQIIGGKIQLKSQKCRIIKSVAREGLFSVEFLTQAVRFVSTSLIRRSRVVFISCWWCGSFIGRCRLKFGTSLVGQTFHGTIIGGGAHLGVERATKENREGA